MQTFHTWCPVFSGFYNTIWEPDDEYTIESLSESEGREVERDEIEFDYASYEKETVNKVTQYLQEKLKDYVGKITLEKIVHLKQYNYGNDAIDICVDVDVEKCSQFLKDFKDEWKEYLLNKYSSYDGFIPFYSNDPKDWEDWFRDEKNDSRFNRRDTAHRVGSVLNFIAETLGVEEINMYYDCSVTIDGTLKEKE